MNAVMTQAVASDPIQRFDASRRRNAKVLIIEMYNTMGRTKKRLKI